jgi:AcrR family transcriptional regulator
MDDLLGTKELIFDAFVEMTSASGYEKVTTRDIANRVGINSSSIYYHFENKEKILEHAYDYYAKHQYFNRKPAEEMKKLIETEDADGIVNAFTYTFVTEDMKKYVRMVLITKIIYMRLFQDAMANTVFAEGNANNFEYVVECLQYGIDKGRIAPDFDIKTFADVLIGSQHIMGIRSFADKDYAVGQLEQQKLIIAMLARLLSTALR